MAHQRLPQLRSDTDSKKDLGDFNGWLKTVTPNWHWDWPHLRIMQEVLNGVTEGRHKRVMFNCPPRHGKSEQNTIRYLVYRLLRDQETRIILGAYNMDLAKKFSRKAIRLASNYTKLATNSVEDWETHHGGGMRAVGVGSGVTGMGAHVIAIDDPVKSREEADSQAYRDRCWDWYKDDLWTRREPNAAIILTMTRWHEDDLAGRLIQEMVSGGEQWLIINMPALCETQEERDKWARELGLTDFIGLPDPLGREPGQALCPDRYDEKALADAKLVLGHSFYSLYQGRPAPPEGGFFKAEWFGEDQRLPSTEIVKGQRVRYWDKAGTADGGDHTVGLLMCRDGHRFIVEDIVRGQWEARKRNKIIRETAEKDRVKYGNAVHIWLEQEGGSGGKESAQISTADLAGYLVHTERPTGDKVVRAEQFAAQAAARNVFLVRAPWNMAYISELCAFPTGKFDDQVDASSGAFNKLAIKRPLRFW